MQVNYLFVMFGCCIIYETPRASAQIRELSWFVPSRIYGPNLNHNFRFYLTEKSEGWSHMPVVIDLGGVYTNCLI